MYLLRQFNFQDPNLDTSLEIRKSRLQMIDANNQEQTRRVIDKKTEEDKYEKSKSLRMDSDFE